MRQGRARKVELTPEQEANRKALVLSLPKIQLNEHQPVGPNPIYVQTETPQVNTVIQAIKGDHIGRLGIIGRIDPDCYKCYVITKGGGRDYFDAVPDEFAVIGKAKKAIKDPIPEHLPSGPETPNINADTSPFGGIK